ncbi:MAG: DUF5615 family PIN-like protein [Actinobacteria bacterium]|nr:DUF5615 family PIN-like protein [Actinomycetota bacterium]
MRFLIDEMFAADVADQLRDVGHDPVHVSEVGLGAGADGDVLGFAATEGRVVVTENAADFLPLLDAQIAAGVAVAPVVIVLKGKLPRRSGGDEPRPRSQARRLG